jgi:hypothetical protein
MAGPQPLELLPDCFSRQSVNAVIDYEDKLVASLSFLNELTMSPS